MVKYSECENCKHNKGVSSNMVKCGESANYTLMVRILENENNERVVQCLKATV